MTKARNIADLLDANGDVKSASLDNVPAVDLTNLSATNLTSGTIPDARITGLDATKLTGSIADARIPASAVSQHATTFDDNAIVNDLSTLALRSATSENAIAYSTSNQFVDVFQDASGVASNTNMPRNDGEFHASVIQTGTAVPTGTELYLKSNSASNNSTTISDSSGNNVSVAFQGNSKNIVDANSDIIGTSAYWVDSGSDRVNSLTSVFSSKANFGTGAFTLAGYFFFNSASGYKPLITFGGWGGNADYNGWSFFHLPNNKLMWYVRQGGSVLTSVESNDLSLVSDTWYHLAVTRDSSGTIKFWKNGVLAGTNTGHGGNIASFDDRNLQLGRNGDDGYTYAGRFDNIVINKGYDLYTTNFTPPTTYYGLTTVANATGNFISNVITASSTTKMGAIVSYQDNQGTNSLNTDIILQLSADNGSNFTTATLTALPNLSTGIKMAKVNDLTVTAGTQLKYKILLANKSAGSKEARIRGVSLQY